MSFVTLVSKSAVNEKWSAAGQQRTRAAYSCLYAVCVHAAFKAIFGRRVRQPRLVYYLLNICFLNCYHISVGNFGHLYLPTSLYLP